MAKEGRNTKTGASVVMSSESVILVHAFLQIHAPKIAAKFASKFENLRLEDHAEQAETLSNALVNTVKAAMLVPGTDVSKALSSLSEHEAENAEEVEAPAESSQSTTLSSKKEKKDKQSKKAKSDKKRKAQEDEDVQEEVAPVQAEEEPEAPTVPVEPATEVEVVETVASRPKKKPAQGERFQRVKSDHVQFLDDRLRDMSYEAKASNEGTHTQSGAGDWGARANADLIVTRGKAFTKEKNKKKRGSYRGGVIDQGSQCVCVH